MEIEQPIQADDVQLAPRSPVLDLPPDPQPDPETPATKPVAPVKPPQTPDDPAPTVPRNTIPQVEPAESTKSSSQAKQPGALRVFVARRLGDYIKTY